MSEWIEFVPPRPFLGTGKKLGTCPKCGGDIYMELVPCPEGRSGCCVAHYGPVCQRCGTQWRRAPVEVR